MKVLVCFVILVLAFSAHAGDSRIKSWKTFNNENGYSFKYPDCWVVEPGGVDDMESPVTKAREISVAETKVCARPLLDAPQPNIVAFRSGWTKTPSKDELLKKLDIPSSNAKSFTFFKRFKIGSNEAYAYVDKFHEPDHIWIRWQVKLYCPDYLVFFTGPAIKNPDPSYFVKFKAGDIALPEPEKTIFESIRCN